MAGRFPFSGASFGRFLGKHAAFQVGKWGLSKTLAGVLVRFTAGRVAVGAAATGFTGYTVKQQLDEAGQRRPLDRRVLADSQELAWLNAAAKPVWDKLNAGIQRLIVEELEPALQRRVPYVGHYLHFKQLTIGDKAPCLGPVTVTESEDGVDFHIGLDFTGDLAIEFSAGVASLEVAELQVQGVVQVALRPLVDELNPVGGITISCLDRPHIDLKIRAGSELVPNLYDFVRSTVDDVIANMIVVPNCVAVPIPTGGRHTDFTALRYPVPKGLLRMKVLGLEGLPEEVASPCLHTQLGAATWRTPPARDASDDAGFFEWATGNVQDFLVYSENQCVDLAAVTSGAFGGQNLGRVRLPVSALLGEESVQLALQSEAGDESSSQLTVSATWLAVGTPGGAEEAAKADEAEKEREMLVSVRVDEIAGLPAQPGKVVPRFSVRAVVDGQAAETSIGTAPATAVSHMYDDAFLLLARRLSSHVSPEGLAEVLEVSQEHAREFLDHCKSHGVEADAAWEGDWCHRAREAAALLTASRNPQFGHISHLPVSRPSELVLELLSHGQGSRRTQVLGKSSQSLAALAGQGGGCLQGPFTVELPGHGECHVHGSVDLRPLQAVSLGTHATE